jgi:hypothetical protein
VHHVKVPAKRWHREAWKVGCRCRLAPRSPRSSPGRM